MTPEEKLKRAMIQEFERRGNELKKTTDLPPYSTPQTIPNSEENNHVEQR